MVINQTANGDYISVKGSKFLGSECHTREDGLKPALRSPHFQITVVRDSTWGGVGTYQNPSIVELRKLFFELENNHQEDPTHDDTTVLDD